MKNCLIILLILAVKSTFGQLNDNFADGELISNPVWTGSGFNVNGNLQLQTSSSGGVPQTVNLVTNNTKVLNAVWEFFIQINIDPTANNQIRVYLISDNQNLNEALNGYFLQVGESGSTDSYDLYRQDGLTLTKIIDGPAKTRLIPTQLVARVKVTRNIEGVWEVQTDISGGTNFVSEGTQTDLTHLSGSTFGIQCKYSSTNSDKFYFDDFSIDHLIIENNPPELLSVNGSAIQKIQVNFNEPISLETALNPANYSLNKGYGQPSVVKTTDALNIFELEFSSELNTDSYVLTVNNLSDFNFNTQTNPGTASFYYEKPYIPQPNDILINEIFADPSPQIDLPTLEFIELWNTSEHPIYLKNWTYSDASTNYVFGEQTLQPNEFVIICASADVANFTAYGKTIGISPWPSLNNSGDQIKLKNENGLLIHEVNYADTWYKDDLKKQGGYSLEMINPKALCTGIQNWSASMDVSGGTPGKINSVHQSEPNIEPLKLISAQLLDAETITIQYNRYVDSTSAAFTGNYQLNNGVDQPVSAIAIAPHFQQVNLKFAASLNLGMHYTLSAAQVSDCSGIILAAPNNTASFYLAENIKQGDILINEILFNPRSGGADFVEIYNNTNHPLDLKELQIGSLDEQNQVINLKTISTTQTLIEPNTYRILSTNPENILAEYTVSKPENLLKINSLPAFNDDAGAVVLISNNTRIDQFNYNESMHFPLIKDAEGVSLERSSFSRPANESGNFRSAAAAIGFATPGYENSQYLADSPSEDGISLSSKTISPDQDGFEDALTIYYQFAAPGMVANTTVYSDKGLLVRKLSKNLTLASSGALVWDGLNDNNEPLPIGIYLIHMQVFDLQGQLKTFVKPCILAAKIN